MPKRDLDEDRFTVPGVRSMLNEEKVRALSMT